MPTDAIGLDTRVKSNAFEGVSAYQWLVVLIASCGWLFDCMEAHFHPGANVGAPWLLRNDPQALSAISTCAGCVAS